MSRRNKPGKQPGLRSEMRTAAFEGLTDDHSKRTYRRGIDRFLAWLRPEGEEARFTPAEVRQMPGIVLQLYCNAMADEGLSAATIHTYLAPLCKALGVPMNVIQKPVRRAAEITRSRDDAATGRNRSGEEIASGRYALSVSLQEALGLRKGELARLTPESLHSDAQGLYVEVRGKGGKLQHQRILPDDAARVQEAFGRGLTGQRLLRPSDLGPHIDYHSIRAAHARDAYAYYLAICQQPGGRERLQAQLYDTLEALHPFRDQHDREHVLATFRQDLTNGHGVYSLRGELRARAQALGRPTEYDRTALMCVSVWHLAHWRNEVTVSHYMI